MHPQRPHKRWSMASPMETQCPTQRKPLDPMCKLRALPPPDKVPPNTPHVARPCPTCPEWEDQPSQVHSECEATPFGDEHTPFEVQKLLLGHDVQVRLEGRLEVPALLHRLAVVRILLLLQRMGSRDIERTHCSRLPSLRRGPNGGLFRDVADPPKM